MERVEVQHLTGVIGDTLFQVGPELAGYYATERAVSVSLVVQTLL